MYEIELYTTPTGNVPVENYVKKLIKKHKQKDIAQIQLYKKRLAEYGMEVNDIYPQTYKYLRDHIYELRPSTTRIFFITTFRNKIIFLHAFEKKRDDVPEEQIEKAIKERADYLRGEQE